MLCIELAAHGQYWLTVEGGRRQKPSFHGVTRFLWYVLEHTSSTGMQVPGVPGRMCARVHTLKVSADGPESSALIGNGWPLFRSADNNCAHIPMP